jgi:hypothetical protein
VKLSELIIKLRRILDTEGDLPVYVSESEYGKSPGPNLSIGLPQDKDYLGKPITEKHLVIE